MNAQQVIEIIDPIIAVVALAPPLCAWCLTEAGQELGEGSHGICPQHSKSVYFTWQAERAKRKQQKH